MNTIELFSGTKSFSKVAEELGHGTLTVDNNPDLKPDIITDIISFKPRGKFDIVWTSPPCTCFSVASIGTHWGGGHRAYQPKTHDAKMALIIIQRTIDIIQELKPKYWFVENPRGVLRKLGLLEQLGTDILGFGEGD